MQNNHLQFFLSPPFSVYAHSDMGSRPTPSISWLKMMNSLFDVRLGNNLMALYIIHPTFMLKAFLGLSTPFLAANMRNKIQMIDDLTHLFRVLKRDQVQLPEFVFK
jgi:hypothetical protein